MTTPGDQSQREGESYAEFMDRLYAANPYSNRKRDETGHYVPSRDGSERPKWSFRVPNDLAKEALKFMREQNMSVTKYLTFAMHNLHNSDKNG